MHKLTNLPQVCHHWVCVRGACNCAASQRQRVCYPAVRLVKTGVIPVLAMPSQRALDIDALIELAQPSLTLFTGKPRRAGSDRWRTNTPACVMFWSLETVMRRFYAALLLHGERQAWPQPDVSATALLLLSGGTTGAQTHPLRHADYGYNFQRFC